jgi:class 3 adenylate cyclase
LVGNRTRGRHRLNGADAPELLIPHFHFESEFGKISRLEQTLQKRRSDQHGTSTACATEFGALCSDSTSFGDNDSVSFKMLEEHTNRRLAAILAADVAGYSRLMSHDETGTLAALRGHRSGLIDPAIGRPSWADREING